MEDPGLMKFTDTERQPSGITALKCLANLFSSYPVRPDVREQERPHFHQERSRQLLSSGPLINVHSRNSYWQPRWGMVRVREATKSAISAGR
jgi:hypothetical protein